MQILSVLRASALGLLAVCMLLGPLATGTSMAAPPVEACGESCPCEAADEEEEADHARAESSHEDDCPEDCRDCSCGSRVVLALVTVAVPCGSAACVSSDRVTLSDSPGLGDVSGVFRPPRAAS